MSWQRNYVELEGGTRVRYTLLRRPGEQIFLVNFRGRSNKRLERSTGESKKPEARESAHMVIREEYGLIDRTINETTWDQAIAKLEEAMIADGKRPKTIIGYQETLRKLTGLFPKTKSPADITAKMANDFKTKYSSRSFSRKRNLKEGHKAPTYPRRPKSVDSRIRTLKAVFMWFRSIGFVDENPFENVSPPELDKHDVKYVRETDIKGFFEWLDARYRGWEMPKLFFMVKALTGCRLDDLCRLRSSALREGRIVFGADLTKNRSERQAPLPAALYARLNTRKGKTFLWEKYPLELIAANKANESPTHRQNIEFDPRRLYLWVVQIMQKHQRETGSSLSSHDFRRAAFTRAAERDVHPKMAAVAFDVTAETMLRYYTATDKRQTSDKVLSSLADVLVPKTA